MKIAILGKGGSGKSTVSWLLSKQFSKDNQVLAIDEDFNMDLIDHFGFEVEDFQTISASHNLFRNVFNLKKGEKWFDLINRSIPEFIIDSPLLTKLAKQVDPNTRLIYPPQFKSVTFCNQTRGH